MNLKSHQFNVAYRCFANNEKRIFEDKSVLSDFIMIKNPPFCWCADPFPIIFEGKKYIFAEIARKYDRFGSIGYICLDDKKPKWTIISHFKYHMSFPNAFIHQNTILMIPETYQDESVSLYSLDLKTKKLIKVKELFNSSFSVDSVFLDSEKLDYVISYDRASNNQFFKLQLRIIENKHYIEKCFMLDKNGTLRPAGNPFLINDNLVLPTQDNRRLYGGGIIFNDFRISYNEMFIKQRCEILPQDIKCFLKIKNAIGCHTYNCCSELEVIDIVQNKFSILRFFKKILSKIKRKKGTENNK